MSRDRLTGTMWIGDVGEGSREEIDVLVPGGDYGWPVMEGAACSDTHPNCDPSAFVAPVLDYGRSEGATVIGGFVYRGSGMPALYGRYVYTDFVSGRVWALDPAAPAQNQIAQGPAVPTGFGETESGDLYLASLALGIYRFSSTGTGGDDDPGNDDPAGPSVELAGPNPLEGPTSIRALSIAGGPARLELLDVVGRRVQTLFDGELAAGQPHTVALDPAGLAPATYVARLFTTDGTAHVLVNVSR
jgi:hypothetical protein